MAELEAVIFDMDGVIIDSEPVHYQVNMELYDELNLEISQEEYKQFIGVSNKDQWRYIKKKYNLAESMDRLISIQAERNIEHLKYSAETPIKGVVALLQELEREKISIALASSSPTSYIMAVLEKFAIENYFSVIVSGEELERSKPYPDIFLKTAEELQVKEENCLVIEDSRHGVAAAKKAGMKSIGFQNPNSGDQDLSQAEYIVDSLEELDLQVMRGLFN